MRKMRVKMRENNFHKAGNYKIRSCLPSKNWFAIGKGDNIEQQKRFPSNKLRNSGISQLM